MSPVAELALHVHSFGLVEQRADHSDRPAGGVPDHKPSIANVSVAAVCPQETILVDPVGVAAVDHGVDARVHPRAVVGMDVLDPPGTGWLYLQ